MPHTLLGLARDDEFAAKSLLPVGATDAIVGFHAQQAVEKCLKAVLAHNGIDFPYTHDLDGLTELCHNNGIDVPTQLADIDELSPYGVQLRYGASRPGGVAVARGAELGGRRDRLGAERYRPVASRVGS